MFGVNVPPGHYNEEHISKVVIHQSNQNSLQYGPQTLGASISVTTASHQDACLNTVIISEINSYKDDSMRCILIK